MKKNLITLLFAVASILTWGQPLLVGHRGSGYGVENTEEAFREGAKLGYAYVETDVKVTKDLKFVLIHDDDLSRFGSSLTITGSTLEQLQAVELTQKRSGVTYTGTLMTIEQLLDLCTELNVKPVIELKWATGINNNDCSNIPLLINAIESKGYRNKCIILTSMKPCLEYIRTNYPDITLQFLTGEYWANHFDWCVNWKIDVDIQAGFFNKLTVQKFHDAGLKVNMWTTNDLDGYKTYGNMRCDFITTDRLDGNNLPELEGLKELVPNTSDFPHLEVPIRGEYIPEKVVTLDYPEVLKGLKVKRALLRNDYWIVLAHDANKTPSLLRISTNTGEYTNISTDGIEGGDITLNDIAFTADGYLTGCNYAIVPHGGGGDVWKLYYWKDIAASPEVYLTVDNGKILGNLRKAKTGDSYTLSGRLESLKIYVTSSINSTYRICGLQVESGVVTKDCYSTDNMYSEENWGDFLMSMTPTSRDNILIDSPKMFGQEFLFDWDTTQVAMTEYSYLNTSIALEPATGTSFLRRASKVYAMVPTCNSDSTNVSAKLYEIGENLSSLTPVTPLVCDDFDKSFGLMASGIEYNESEGATYIYLFVEGQGIIKMLMDKNAESEKPKRTDMVLERLWIQSNTTNNVPEHISGDNAQQGTAVNGYFYINDSADKLIYVYNSEGLVGTLPGGAGYGCTRDDVGNIIVRNDQETGTNHSVLIYEVGSLPGNYKDAISVSFDVLLDGQTNFINASGDVLNGNGYIYMFPNKQTAANIVKFENGVVVKVSKSSELSITGSAAGYIVPNDNNSENWYYQVRGNGIYQYNGGVNSQIQAAKTNTTQPTMNTTGGFAMLKIKGNQFLIHNSGAHYKGGFTVRNLTLDKVVTSVEPIGTLGYEDGGNRSTFNWIIAEKVTPYEYTIYQYCPANGIACYRLYDKKETGIESAEIDNIEILFKGDQLIIEGAEENSISEIFDLSGKKILSSKENAIDVSGLISGVYIIKVGNSTAKFMK